MLCCSAPVPDLRQPCSPLEVAHKQVLDSTVGAARQQHGDGLPVVAVTGLRLHGRSRACESCQVSMHVVRSWMSA